MTYIIAVMRLDGSTITSRPVTREQALTMLRELTETDVMFTRIALYDSANAPNVDQGPVLPLEEALKWQQPNDLFTRILRPR